MRHVMAGLLGVCFIPLWLTAAPRSAAISRLRTENRVGAMTRDATGVVRDLWLTDGIRFFGSPAWTVRHFLERYPEIGCGNPDNLVLKRKMPVQGGHVLRFQQVIHDRPVFRAGVVAEVVDGRVTMLANRTESIPENSGSFSYPSRDQVIAWLRTGKPTTDLVRLRLLEKGIYHRRAAVRVWVSDDTGDWERILDGESGRELFRRSLRHQDNSGYTGYVFVTNPVTATGDCSLTDMDDAATDALNAARSQVPLPTPSPSGQLKNQYVDLTARGMTPGTVAGYYPGLATGDNGKYLYDRDDPRFEEVNAYYWISRSSKHIADDLGFPQAVDYPIPVNVHFMSNDTSYYTETDRGLHFGDGGVDDAEDAEIVLHEYGHAVIHNLVPGLGGSWESGALDEGTSDYISASLSHDPTFPDTIGEWDATAYDSSGLVPPRLRPIVTDRIYPDNMREPYPQPWSMQADIHWDGVIWSAALWQAREHIGADPMDRIVLRGLMNWSPDMDFRGAALRLLNAEQALYHGEVADPLRYVLTRRGLLSDSYIVSPDAPQSPIRLVFPLPRKTGETHGELGVVNLSTDPAEIRYQVVGDNGCAVYPSVSTAIPGQGRVFLDPLAGRTLDGCWVLMESDQPVAGYVRILSGSPVQKAAFVPASAGSADTLVVPHIATATAYWDTFTTLIHTGEDPISVHFENGGSGLDIPEVSGAYRLDDWEWASDRYGGTFPEGFSGWGRFVADQPELAGMELFGKKGDDLHQLAGLAFGDTPAQRLIFAHVASNTHYWWTGAVLCNTTDQPVSVSMTARSAGGDELDTISFQLNPGEKVVKLVPDFWSSEGRTYPTETAWLDVQADQPALVGVELFGTLPESGDRLLAGLSPATSVSTELVCPHVDEDTQAFWTGIAWVNTGTDPASVQVTALNDAGTVLATTWMTEPVPSRGKVVTLVQDLFDGALPAGTTQIRLKADQPLAGFELWGNLLPEQDYVAGMLAVPVSPVPLTTQSP